MFPTEARKNSVDEILDVIPNQADLIIPIANGEPDAILSALDQQANRYTDVHIHQMLPLRERRYIEGAYLGHIRYVSYFLSGASRKAFLEGKCDLVPNHFHEMPRILADNTRQPIVVAVASPMDSHGYFSLGTQADYASPFIGKVPFILEVNQQMPRTSGDNQIHISQVAAYIETDYPLHELKSPPISDTDRQIATLVAERIGDGSTLQVGIGGVPNAILSLLSNHKDLGVHTEMLTEGIVDLAEKGAITGLKKNLHTGKIVATFAYGTKRLYDFIHENRSVEFYRVDHINDPRVIGQEDNIVSINSTTEVDFFGQCASETVAGRYYSSTGGQSDFARGARFAKNGKGFICLTSTAKDGAISRIRPQLTHGSAVTTSKNDVDHVVTEYGVAELSGKSISRRIEALIGIAHPKFREELRAEAERLGLVDKRVFSL